MRPIYLDAIEAEFAQALDVKPVVHTEKVSLFIAHRDRYGCNVPDVQDWVARAEAVLAPIGGGATSLLMHGVWLGDRHRPLSEDTTLVYTYAPPDKILTHLRSIRTFVFEYGARTAQEEVAVLLENADGNWFFRIAMKQGNPSPSSEDDAEATLAAGG